MVRTPTPAMSAATSCVAPAASSRANTTSDASRRWRPIIIVPFIRCLVWDSVTERTATHQERQTYNGTRGCAQPWQATSDAGVRAFGGSWHDGYQFHRGRRLAGWDTRALSDEHVRACLST